MALFSCLSSAIAKFDTSNGIVASVFDTAVSWKQNNQFRKLLAKSPVVKRNFGNKDIVCIGPTTAKNCNDLPVTQNDQTADSRIEHQKQLKNDSV